MDPLPSKESYRARLSELGVVVTDAELEVMYRSEYGAHIRHSSSSIAAPPPFVIPSAASNGTEGGSSRTSALNWILSFVFAEELGKKQALAVAIWICGVTAISKALGSGWVGGLFIALSLFGLIGLVLLVTLIVRSWVEEFRQLFNRSSRRSYSSFQRFARIPISSHIPKFNAIARLRAFGMGLCVAILGVICFPPVIYEIDNRTFRIVEHRGFRFVLDKQPFERINVELLALELLALLGIAAVAYFVFLRNSNHGFLGSHLSTSEQREPTDEERGEIVLEGNATSHADEEAGELQKKLRDYYNSIDGATESPDKRGRRRSTRPQIG